MFQVNTIITDEYMLNLINELEINENIDNNDIINFSIITNFADIGNIDDIADIEDNITEEYLINLVIDNLILL